MVPATFVRLAALPLTPNGKLDRKALPAPEEDAHGAADYEPPAGPVEEALAAIWAECLGVARVSRLDNFFELGGHSLLAVRVLERMRAQRMQADVRLLFTAANLAETAAMIEIDQGGDQALAAPPAGCDRVTPAMLPLASLSQAEIDMVAASVPGGHRNIQDIYPLTTVQEGILFHHLMAQGGDGYVMVNILAFDTKAKLDATVDALNRAGCAA
jgi:hypothetical protein